MDVRVDSGANNAAENVGFPVEYQITLKIAVEDAGALWCRAANRCVEEAGLSAEELEETIGPREDPSIEDCLATALLPAELAGCRLVDIVLQATGRHSETLDSEGKIASVMPSLDAAPFATSARFGAEPAPSGFVWRS